MMTILYEEVTLFLPIFINYNNILNYIWYMWLSPKYMEKPDSITVKISLQLLLFLLFWECFDSIDFCYLTEVTFKFGNSK